MNDPRQTAFQKKYDDCLALFLKYNGKNISRIEREMRALGHANFSRRILYSRFERGVYKPGWIERFGWPELCKSYAFTREDASPNDSHDRQPLTADRQPDDSFHAWLKRVSPGMHWDWKHQKYIYKHLQKVTDGECKRLMIFLPPRHGKSELVTVRYSAWRLQQKPSLNIILGSYNQRLANRFSRKVRRVLSDAAELQRPAQSSGETASVTCGNEKETGNGSGCSICSSCSSRSVVSEKTGTADRHDRTRNQKCSADSHCSCNPRSETRPAEAWTPNSRPANSLAEWETPAGGGLRAVGVGGGVTGFGAGLIVIDDPVKSRAEAESETYRDNLWDWFNDDLYTRLEPDGAIILIQTRWHEDDLAGRLLKEMEDGGDQWDVVLLPALAEPGNAGTPACTDAAASSPAPAEATETKQLKANDEAPILNSQLSIINSVDPLGRAVGQALCPERYDEAALARTQRKLGTYSFSALYQQRPTPPDGGLFKKQWFKRTVPAPPPGLKWKRGYDLAISTKTTADYTASFRCAYDAAGNLYIDGGFRKRIEFPEQRRFILQKISDETDTEHGIELALHGQAILQDLRRDAGIRGRAFRGVKVETDKLTRALPWANLAEEGKVFLVRGAWNTEFLDEVCQFPFGRFDDQVDAVSLAVKMTTERRRIAYGF